MQNDQEKASKERSRAITGGITSGISSAAQLIGSSVDFLTEILLLFSAKTLIRFKCVSKHWLSLISDSQFGRNHYIRNPMHPISGLYLFFHSRLHFVSFRGCRNLPSLSFLDGLGEHPTTTILDSCNGLLLCYCGYFDGGIYRQQHVVCNPTTKKYKILPSSNLFKPYSVYAYLAFHPSKSLHYKVLLFSYPSWSSCQVVDVYCSQTACWKEVTIKQKHLGRGVFWNGAIHWFSCANSLMRFDVGTEEVIVMPNPQTPKILTQDNTKYFGENGRRLILIQSALRDPLEFRILELDKGYCGWIVKCRVNLRPLVAAFPEMKRKSILVLKALCVANGDKEKKFALILAIPGRIVSYDLKCKTWDVLCDLLVDEIHVCEFNHVYPVIENLSPV